MPKKETEVVETPEAPKKLDLETFGLRKRKKLVVVTRTNDSGLKEMVESWKVEDVVQGYLTKEEAAMLPALGWKPHNIANHGKYMTIYEGRKFFVDEIPAKGKLDAA